jgi:hypothetical protein
MPRMNPCPMVRRTRRGIFDTLGRGIKDGGGERRKVGGGGFLLRLEKIKWLKVKGFL